MTPTKSELDTYLVSRTIRGYTEQDIEQLRLWQILHDAVWGEEGKNQGKERRCLVGMVVCRHNSYRPLTVHPIIRPDWDLRIYAVLGNDGFEKEYPAWESLQKRLLFQTTNAFTIEWSEDIGERAYPFGYDSEGLDGISSLILKPATAGGYAWVFSDRIHINNQANLIRRIADCDPAFVKNIIDGLRNAGGLR